MDVSWACRALSLPSRAEARHLDVVLERKDVLVVAELAGGSQARAVDPHPADPERRHRRGAVVRNHQPQGPMSPLDAAHVLLHRRQRAAVDHDRQRHRVATVLGGQQRVDQPAQRGESSPRKHEDGDLWPRCADGKLGQVAHRVDRLDALLAVDRMRRRRVQRRAPLACQQQAAFLLALTLISVGGERRRRGALVLGPEKEEGEREEKKNDDGQTLLPGLHRTVVAAARQPRRPGPALRVKGRAVKVQAGVPFSCLSGRAFARRPSFFC